MSPEQLVLALDLPETNGTRMTVATAGLRRECPPGPERLLRELVKRGLGHDHFHAAAALVVVLEEDAGG